MSDNVHLMACCNNPDNGNNTGYAEAFEMMWKASGASIRLEDGRIRWRVEDQRIKIGRRWYRHYGYRTWVGNWCWDGAWISSTDAVDILNRLQADGWQCDEAESRVFDKWALRQPLTVDDFKRSCDTQEER